MIRDNITNLIAESMKAHNELRTNTLRLIKAELLKAEVKDRKAYNESVENKTIMKMVAAHKDSIEQFKGRQDLIDKELAELEIIQEFAPKESTEEEIIATTRMLIELRNHDTPVKMSDMKAILASVQEIHPTANGKLVSKILKEYI